MHCLAHELLLIACVSSRRLERNEKVFVLVQSATATTRLLNCDGRKFSGEIEHPSNATLSVALWRSCSCLFLPLANIGPRSENPTYRIKIERSALWRERIGRQPCDARFFLSAGDRTNISRSYLMDHAVHAAKWTENVCANLSHLGRFRRQFPREGNSGDARRRAHLVHASSRIAGLTQRKS